MIRTALRTATAGVAAAALILFLGGGALAASTLPPVPAFTMTLLDGKALSLADLKGKPVLLNFWQAG